MKEFELNGFDSEEEYKRHNEECKKTENLVKQIDWEELPSNLKPKDIPFEEQAAAKRILYLTQENARLVKENRILTASLNYRVSLDFSGVARDEKLVEERDRAYCKYAEVSLELEKLKEQFNSKVAETALEYIDEIANLRENLKQVKKRELEIKGSLARAKKLYPDLLLVS
jgi:hypothetical protein